MPARLLDLLAAKFVFFVGKGGVGKSTSAAAVALRLADDGEEVRLVSTDPAHSLGDLFGVALPPGTPTPSPCTPRLVLEEIDGRARAQSWLERVREPVAELVDMGTYLDRESISALLDRSLPGMDELMAALRLAELSERDEGRVVVDTAPTGHLLRMLDSGEVLDGWSHALSAMADKAGAVASGLTGRRVRFAGEQVVAELSAQVERFRQRVLEEADFVVVTRGEEVVGAETSRLQRELAGRGCRVQALIDVGGTSPPDGGRPAFVVPWRHEGIGCEALRSWGDAEAEAPPPAARPDARGGRERVLEAIGGRDLYLFAGKGGVGKSTCAAAFALALGGERDVLLLGTDPAGSLGDVLGIPVGSSDTPCAPRVVARELDAEAELEAFRTRHRERIRAVFGRMGLTDAAALDRRVLESVIQLAPSGIDEIFAIDAILDAVGDRRALVVDAAPTGHLLRLVEMPELARAWTRTMLRVLLEYRSVLGLEDFATQLLQLARRIEDLIALLRDATRAAAVIVTLDEPLPEMETRRLAEGLGAAGVPVAAVVRNRSSSGRPGAGAATSSGARRTILAPLVDPPPVGPDSLGDFLDRWSLV